MSPALAAVVTIRDPALAEAVLERVAGALAARVDLPVDRLLDAQIVLEAVAAGAARHGRGEALIVRFGAAPGTVSIRVGPLAEGAAARLLEDGAVPQIGPVVERMVDGWSIDRDEGGEHLSLTVGTAAPRPAA